jgi:arylsulfatase A-like enzyme
MWERGRAILALQDRHVGELVGFLKERGRLDRTILVVTGDHGVRTRAEDPIFEGGMIDDYSFHVPLIVHAPAALGERVTIPWITSHIDVAPTVLDLLGCDAGRESEQGTPIWDPRLNERVTFFLANHYLGADGYHDQGKFRMFSTVWGSAYAGDELHFTHRELAQQGSETHEQAQETIGYMIALQEAWGSTFMKPSPATR